MGRFRTFSKHKTMDSSEYNRDLDAKSFYSYSRLKYPDKKDENFRVNYQTYDIDYFKSYDTFLKFSRGMSLLNPYTNFYCDIPTNLDQGIEALIYYPDSQATAHNCKLFSCNCKCYDLLEDVNKCKEITGRLYPYGYVNNNTLGRYAEFPSRVNVFSCADKIEGPKYKICRCRGENDCGCKTYQEMFPTQYKFIFYNKNCITDKTESGVNCEKDKEKYMNAFSVFPKNEVEDKMEEPSKRTKGVFRKGSSSLFNEKSFLYNEKEEIDNSLKNTCNLETKTPGKKLPKKPPPRVKRLPKKPNLSAVSKVTKQTIVAGPVVWKNGNPQPLCCPSKNLQGSKSY